MRPLAIVNNITFERIYSSLHKLSLALWFPKKRPED
jgi:hypothetical protein